MLKYVRKPYRRPALHPWQRFCSLVLLLVLWAFLALTIAMALETVTLEN